MNHLTAAAERYCRERIAQCNDILPLWNEDGGILIPTEPCAEERHAIRERLLAARYALIELLIKYCGSNEQELLSLSLNGPHSVLNYPEAPH